MDVNNSIKLKLYNNVTVKRRNKLRLTMYRHKTVKHLVLPPFWKKISFWTTFHIPRRN